MAQQQRAPRLPSSRDVRRWYAGPALVRRGRGCLARAARELASAEVAALDGGAQVFVEETVEVGAEKTLRSRLSRPVRGWVSAKLLEKVTLLRGRAGFRAAGLGKALEVCFLEGDELVTVQDPRAADIAAFFKREPGLRAYFELGASDPAPPPPPPPAETNIVDDPSLLMVVVSCEKHKHLWAGIRKRLEGVPHVFLVGGGRGAGPDTWGAFEVERDNILDVNCSDAYEGLPEKILYMAHAVRRMTEFAHVTHARRTEWITIVLKVDDHDASVDAAAFWRLAQHVKEAPGAWHYCGQRVIRAFQGNRRWHFDKVSPESVWCDVPYAGPYVPWADGAASYVLSAASLDVLARAFPVVDLPHALVLLRKTEIYEDIMVAKVLRAADIEPRQVDYGAVWTPEA